jgi:hypothetical protein
MGRTDGGGAANLARRPRSDDAPGQPEISPLALEVADA